jgi:hypothetical protein
MFPFSGRSRAARKPRERTQSQPRRYQPLLEPLKDRTLPASVGFALDLGRFNGGAVTVDSARDVYTIGGLPDGNVAVVKYSSSGQLDWVRDLSNLDLEPGVPYGFGRGFSSASSLAVDTAGDVYVGLNGSSSGIAKFNASGQVIWIRILGTPPGSERPVSVGINALAVDSDGNVYTTGGFNNNYSNNPLTLYEAFPGLPTQTVPASVFSMQNDPSWGSNTFIVEFNSYGQLVWGGGLLVHQPPAFNNYYASVNGIAADGAGNIYLGGAFAGSVNFDPNGGVYNVNTANYGGNGATGPLPPDTFALKLNVAHQLVWFDDLRSIGSGSDSYANGLTADAAGNVFLTGGHEGDVNFDPGPGDHEIINQNGAFVEKLDTDGAFQWVANAVGYNAQGFAAALDSAGNVYSTGILTSPTNFGTAVLAGPNAQNGYVWKLDANGNPIWAGGMIGSAIGYSDGRVQGLAIALDSAGDIFTTGEMYHNSPVNFLPGPGEFDLSYPETDAGFLVKLVQNTPPTASAGGPYTMYEGNSLTLNAGASIDPDGDTLTYSWDVNGDGVFGDATGVSPTLTWGQLVALGIGPGTFNVRVQVDDGHGNLVTSRSRP